MNMPERGWKAQEHRFGFQNQEEDKEFWGGAVSYKYRIHDPRVGRFFSVDPLAPEYPFYSTYVFSGNRVIDRIELEGLEPKTPPGNWEKRDASDLDQLGVDASACTSCYLAKDPGANGWSLISEAPTDMGSSYAHWSREKQDWQSFSPKSEGSFQANLRLQLGGITGSGRYEDLSDVFGGILYGGAGLGIGGAAIAAVGYGSAASFLGEELTDFAVEEVTGLPISPLSVGDLAEGVGKLAWKESSQGGLNLFKWGATQTGSPSWFKEGDYFLFLPNQGTPQLNWKANYGALRREMGLGKPIYDSYRFPNGNLIPTKGFLNAERFTLRERGWNYYPGIGAWLPPGL